MLARSDAVGLLATAPQCSGLVRLGRYGLSGLGITLSGLSLILTLFSDSVRPSPAVTPLHRAALIGSVEDIEVLLAKGSDVDAFDEKGMTALHMTAANGHMVR